MSFNTKIADRLFLIISDVEMGDGSLMDDFPHTQFLSDFITRYNREDYAHIEMDLVFNGDTFDFLKISVEGIYHHLIDEELALNKLAIIERAHGNFFSALRAFLDYGSRPRRAHFLVGNHDQELLYSKVQDRIVALCGHSGQVHFPGYEMRVGDLKIEHGSQKDDLFEVPVAKPFLVHQGKKILNLPWASVTLLNAFIPFHRDFSELDRIKPKTQLFESLPELKDWFMARLWNYWTKDYLREYLTFSDPLKKVGWSMIKEGFRRSLFFNTEVIVGPRFFKELETSAEIKVQVVGHGHDPKIVCYGDRKVILSGCFRDEFMLMDGGERYVPIPKSYVEVFFKENRVLSSNLMEIPGPSIESTRYPRPIKELRELVREMLAAEKSQTGKSTPQASPLSQSYNQPPPENLEV